MGHGQGELWIWAGQIANAGLLLIKQGTDSAQIPLCPCDGWLWVQTQGLQISHNKR